TMLLERPDFRGVFAEMCTDVLRCCRLAGGDEHRAVEKLVDRLGAWKELFRGSGPQPLGDEEQLGLYGELLFLEELITRNIQPASAVDAWKGPLKDPHDFHLGSVHVEVKTTASGLAAIVRIR